jgi:histone acetyltransferase 1
VLFRALTTDEDYLKDRATFEQQVEKDAVTFKPMGKKIYSYSRRASARSDAERRGKVDTSVNEEDEDATVFEVYHVRYSTCRGASS